MLSWAPLEPPSELNLPYRLLDLRQDHVAERLPLVSLEPVPVTPGVVPEFYAAWLLDEPERRFLFRSFEPETPEQRESRCLSGLGMGVR
jgi:hypothetical protein